MLATTSARKRSFMMAKLFGVPVLTMQIFRKGLEDFGVY